MLSLWFWVPIWLIVAWLGLSVYSISPSELAAVYLFNKKWHIIRSGWYLYPLGIFTIKRFTTKIQRQMTPGKKEYIERDDSVSLTPGMVRAVRIIHASAENALYWVPKDPKNRESKLEQRHFSKLTKKEQERRSAENDALQSSITTEIIAFADFNLKSDDESLFSFVENVGTLEEAGKRLDGTVRGALQELMAPITARHATEMKSYIEHLIKERLELLVGEGLVGEEEQDDDKKAVEKGWGVNISAFQIEEINPGKTVNLARSEEAASVSLKAKAIREGEGQAGVIKEIAEADAFKEITLGTAKAEAFQKMAKVMETPGGLMAAQLETAKEVLSKSGTIVLSGTNGDPAGIVGSMTAVAKAVATSK